MTSVYRTPDRSFKSLPIRTTRSQTQSNIHELSDLFNDSPGLPVMPDFETDLARWDKLGSPSPAVPVVPVVQGSPPLAPGGYGGFEKKKEGEETDEIEELDLVSRSKLVEPAQVAEPRLHVGTELEPGMGRSTIHSVRVSSSSSSLSSFHHRIRGDGNAQQITPVTQMNRILPGSTTSSASSSTNGPEAGRATRSRLAQRSTPPSAGSTQSIYSHLSSSTSYSASSSRHHTALTDNSTVASSALASTPPGGFESVTTSRILQASTSSSSLANGSTQSGGSSASLYSNHASGSLGLTSERSNREFKRHVSAPLQHQRAVRSSDYHADVESSEVLLETYALGSTKDRIKEIEGNALEVLGEEQTNSSNHHLGDMSNPTELGNTSFATATLTARPPIPVSSFASSSSRSTSGETSSSSSASTTIRDFQTPAGGARTLTSSYTNGTGGATTRRFGGLSRFGGPARRRGDIVPVTTPADADEQSKAAQDELLRTVDRERNMDGGKERDRDRERASKSQSPPIQSLMATPPKETETTQRRNSIAVSPSVMDRHSRYPPDFQSNANDGREIKPSRLSPSSRARMHDMLPPTIQENGPLEDSLALALPRTAPPIHASQSSRMLRPTESSPGSLQSVETGLSLANHRHSPSAPFQSLNGQVQIPRGKENWEPSPQLEEPRQYSKSTSVLPSDVQYRPTSPQPLQTIEDRQTPHTYQQQPTQQTPMEYYQELHRVSPPHQQPLQSQAPSSRYADPNQQMPSYAAQYQQQQQQQGSSSMLPFDPQQQQQQHQQQMIAQRMAPPAPAALPARKTFHVNGVDYERLGILGKGGSSKVYSVLDPNKRVVLALKRVALDRADPDTLQSYTNEIHLLERLRGHERIIQLLGHQTSYSQSGRPKMLQMLMECGETDFAMLLDEKRGKPLDMNFVGMYWQQMLQAVHAVHQQNVVHTDLKPANFVLVKGRLKIIDFGIAKAVANDTVNIHRDQQIGTVNYMSPEAVQRMNNQKVFKLSYPSDVWSLGCILYQMIYGGPPFQHIAGGPLVKMNVIGSSTHTINYLDRVVAKVQVGPDGRAIETAEGEEGTVVMIRRAAIDAMKSCLRYDKDARLTIPQLLEHSFFKLETENGGGGPSLPPNATAITEAQMKLLIDHILRESSRLKAAPKGSTEAAAELFVELAAQNQQT